MSKLIEKEEIVNTLEANKKPLILFASLGIISIFSAWFYFSPYLTVQGIQKAASEKNTEEISKHIDYPALRESVKAQIQAQLQKEMAKQAQSGNPFAAFGMAFAQSMVEPMVNTIVSPQEIAAAMQGKSPNAEQNSAKDNAEQAQTTPTPQDPPSEPEISMGYESFNVFVVQVKSKKSDLQSLGLVFKRNGLDWKLSELRLPEPSNTTASQANPKSPALTPTPSSTPQAEASSVDKGLLKAATTCDYELAKILLDKGANPNTSIASFSFGQSEEIPIMTALEKTIEASSQVASSVAIFGDLDKRELQNYRLCYKVVQFLLDHKANPNIVLKGTNSAGQSPLHAIVADEHINPELITLLLQKGADPYIQTAKSWALESVLGKGATPLMLLSKNRLVNDALIYKVANRMGKYDSKKEAFFLVAKAANINAQDEKGKTALMVAANEGFENITQEILKLNADPNLKDKENKTALDYAIEKGNTQLIKLLTEKTKK
jgi:ankyrin repeat protein